MGTSSGSRLVRLVVGLAAAAGALVMTGGGVAEAHGGGTNGCTLSPDSSYVPVYYNFHEACDAHDRCYINKPHGDSSAGRRACDDAFRADMYRWCTDYYWRWWQGALRATCKGVADTYYTAVRTFGGAFF